MANKLDLLIELSRPPKRVSTGFGSRSKTLSAQELLKFHYKDLEVRRRRKMLELAESAEKQWFLLEASGYSATDVFTCSSQNCSVEEVDTLVDISPTATVGSAVEVSVEDLLRAVDELDLEEIIPGKYSMEDLLVAVTSPCSSPSLLTDVVVEPAEPLEISFEDLIASLENHSPISSVNNKSVEYLMLEVDEYFGDSSRVGVSVASPCSSPSDVSLEIPSPHLDSPVSEIPSAIPDLLPDSRHALPYEVPASVIFVAGYDNPSHTMCLFEDAEVLVSQNKCGEAISFADGVIPLPPPQPPPN